MPIITTKLTKMKLEIPSLDLSVIEYKFYENESFRFSVTIKEHDPRIDFSKHSWNTDFSHKFEKISKKLKNHTIATFYIDSFGEGNPVVEFVITWPKKKHPVTAEVIKQLVTSYFDLVDEKCYEILQSYKEFDSHF